MDLKFLHEDEIVFNAGILDKSIFIRVEDFIGSTNPRMASISKVLEP
jgi:prolyl-tRNA editing enzyme YbaK/EbsC (Cys-tRNA(Pro) deacylase)